MTAGLENRHCQFDNKQDMESLHQVMVIEGMIEGMIDKEEMQTREIQNWPMLIDNKGHGC